MKERNKAVLDIQLLLEWEIQKENKEPFMKQENLDTFVRMVSQTFKSDLSQEGMHIRITNCSIEGTSKTSSDDSVKKFKAVYKEDY